MADKKAKSLRNLFLCDYRVEIAKPQTTLATRIQIQSIFKRLVWTAGSIGTWAANL